MLDLSRIRQAVTRGRVDHQIKLLTGFLEFVGELHGILHMHVVVYDAVDEHQFAA